MILRNNGVRRTRRQQQDGIIAGQSGFDEEAVKCIGKGGQQNHAQRAACIAFLYHSGMASMRLGMTYGGPIDEDFRVGLSEPGGLAQQFDRFDLAPALDRLNDRLR